MQESEEEGTCKGYLWIVQLYLKLGYGAAILGAALTFPFFKYILKRARHPQAARERALDILVNQV